MQAQTRLSKIPRKSLTNSRAFTKHGVRTPASESEESYDLVEETLNCHGEWKKTRTFTM
jgi:hypothetical protein